ncbi:endolytic transglycosylase MltG [Alteromonas sp. AMM-1]|uniref:endolytic transglycosylase MltG n=1 Tax=Alteromonas sp. AMM-1 TaxID=3394233 RepID=UPI0039A42745
MRKLLILVLLLIAAGMAANGWFQQQLNTPLVLSSPVLYTLPGGQTAIATINEFDRNGWLPMPRKVARLWLKFVAGNTRIRAGTYEIQPGKTLAEVFAQLASGQEAQFNITLIEGLTFEQWAQILVSHPRLTNDLSEESLQPVLNSWRNHADQDVTSLEGLLLAETYRFTAGTKASVIVQRASNAMQTYLLDNWEKRIGGLPYKTPFEVLIMASIIEKETALEHERAHIAGVFVNRLDRNMRLQTDPTVIYGLGEQFDGNLTRKHLREDTPYNTYVHKGLPPGPIAMIGKAAVNAALLPEITDDLYFVAKGDGSHVFSATLAEHNQAVRQYQLKIEDK